MVEMTDKEFLKAVRTKIETPAAWIKGNLATDGRGERTGPLRENAVCFCLVGAAEAVAGGPTWRGWGRLDGLITSFLPKWARQHTPSFNDDPRTTHSRVLKLLDKAIAGLPEERQCTGERT